MELKSSVNLGLIKEAAEELLNDYGDDMAESFIISFSKNNVEHKFLVSSLSLPTVNMNRNEFGVMMTTLSEMRLTVAPTENTNSEPLRELFYDDKKTNFILHKVNGNGNVETIYFCNGAIITEINAPMYDNRIDDIDLVIKIDYFTII